MGSFAPCGVESFSSPLADCFASVGEVGTWLSTMGHSYQQSKGLCQIAPGNSLVTCRHFTQLLGALAVILLASNSKDFKNSYYFIVRFKL